MTHLDYQFPIISISLYFLVSSSPSLLLFWSQHLLCFRGSHHHPHIKAFQISALALNITCSAIMFTILASSILPTYLVLVLIMSTVSLCVSERRLDLHLCPMDPQPPAPLDHFTKLVIALKASQNHTNHLPLQAPCHYHQCIQMRQLSAEPFYSMYLYIEMQLNWKSIVMGYYKSTWNANSQIINSYAHFTNHISKVFSMTTGALFISDQMFLPLQLCLYCVTPSHFIKDYPTKVTCPVLSTIQHTSKVINLSHIPVMLFIIFCICPC